jgi:homoserine kinase
VKRATKQSHPIKIVVPASIGNVGPGFDVLGLAVSLYNTLEVKVLSKKPGKPLIHISGDDSDILPTDRSNVCYKAFTSVFNRLNRGIPQVEMHLTNRIPLARGLGSSACARLAGALAANAICNSKLSETEIVNLVARMEGHPDNVAASMWGGLVTSIPVGKNEWIYQKMQVAKALHIALAIPDFEVSTPKARAILPKKVPLSDAVFNLSRVVSLVSALEQGDKHLLWLALQDRLHQPYRAKLIPGFNNVLAAAKKAGALGAAISGSGPTIFAICTSSNSANKVASAMSRAFSRATVNSAPLVTRICHNGTRY